MQYSVQDREHKELLELQVSFHLQAIQEFLLGSKGVMGVVFEYAKWLLLLWLCVGIQLSWTDFFPEVPCYPAVLLVAYLSGGRRLWGKGLMTALLVGALLGGGWGLSCRFTRALTLVLVVVSCCCRQLEEHWPGRKFPLLAPMLQGGLSCLVFGLVFLFCLGGELSTGQRLTLLGCRVIPSALWQGILLSPVVFSGWDLVLWRRKQNQMQ